MPEFLRTLDSIVWCALHATDLIEPGIDAHVLLAVHAEEELLGRALARAGQVGGHVLADELVELVEAAAGHAARRVGGAAAELDLVSPPVRKIVPAMKHFQLFFIQPASDGK